MKHKLLNFIKLMIAFTGKSRNDHVTAFAAQAAFFILLSFFPFFMTLLTMTSLLPFTVDDISVLLLSVIPEDLYKYIKPVIIDVFKSTSTTVFSASILIMMWSAAKSVMSIKNGLNTIYKIEETRNYLLLRFVAMLYTIAFLILILVIMVLLVFGNQIVKMMLQSGGALEDIGNLINQSRVMLSTGLMLLMFILIYQVLPNKKTALLEAVPGAVFTTAGWLIVTFLFSIYVDHFSNLSLMYGSLAGIIIVLIWLYVIMMIVFYGAEINYFVGKHFKFFKRKKSKKEDTQGMGR